jgi:protein-L-isoaspartate(D-aspartate) O-methyltransferase
VSFETQRELMVSRQLQARGIRDSRVLSAMRRVPRHLFVSPDQQDQAYGDFPLPIGEGQTISQPFMVATMLADLRLKGHEHILEIGSGSGYNAALIAELAATVISIERIANLAERARELVAQLGYKNIRIEIGDGTFGWQEGAPYDGIVVTAGAPRVPSALLNQLAIGGRLVVPVGGRSGQVLEIHTKVKQDRFDVETDTACRFVSLIGKDGWDT